MIKRSYVRMLTVALEASIFMSGQLNNHIPFNISSYASQSEADWKDNVRAGFESRYSDDELKDFLDEVDKLAKIRSRRVQ